MKKRKMLFGIATAVLILGGTVPDNVNAQKMTGEYAVQASDSQSETTADTAPAPTVNQGGCKVNGKVYVFDEQGRILKNKKNKMVTVLGNKYYITTKNGNPATGYFVYRNNLYYADATGKCVTNCAREKGKYYFTASGAAKKNTDALLKIQVMQTLSRITNSKMTRSQKLKACWDYTTDRAKMRYGGEDPNLKKKGWYNETALKMLKTRTGNCFSFACAFAALARELGYKNIKIMVGYDHCWITIGGKHYDPQTQWSGWVPGVYGLGKHPISPHVLKTYNFMK